MSKQAWPSSAPNRIKNGKELAALQLPRELSPPPIRAHLSQSSSCVERCKCRFRGRCTPYSCCASTSVKPGDSLPFTAPTPTGKRFSKRVGCCKPAHSQSEKDARRSLWLILGLVVGVASAIGLLVFLLMLSGAREALDVQTRRLSKALTGEIGSEVGRAAMLCVSMLTLVPVSVLCPLPFRFGTGCCQWK